MSNTNLGVIYLLLVPLGAAMVHFADVEVGGFHLGGWLWILYLLTAMVLILADRALNPDSRIHFPLVPWGLWAAFVWASLFWCEGVGRRNVQDALQVTAPLAVGVLASMYIRTPKQLSQLFVASAVALALIIVRVVLIRAGVVENVLVGGSRIFSITALLIGGMGLACASQSPLAGYLIWLGCLTATAGTGSRTTTAALLVLPILNPLYRNLAWRSVMAGGVAVAALGIFYSPQFQKRFFYEGHGTLTQVFRGEFLSFGRFEAWPFIFSEACQRPWLGHGIGEVVEFVPTVWPEEDKPHNDYLRIFYETGLIGFLAFWGTLVWQFFQARAHMHRSQGMLRVAFGASMLAIWGFAILSCTDNIWIYNLYYNNLMFALIGGSYGLASVPQAELQSTQPRGTIDPSSAHDLFSPLFPSRQGTPDFPLANHRAAS